LILDVVMPVLSGPLAFARIDAVAPGTAVLFTSGYHESTGAHALPTGTIVLAKPYESHDLLRAVRAALDASRRATCAPATPA
jgi:FixJ family two-component response regulator